MEAKGYRPRWGLHGGQGITSKVRVAWRLRALCYLRTWVISIIDCVGLYDLTAKYLQSVIMMYCACQLSISRCTSACTKRLHSSKLTNKQTWLMVCVASPPHGHLVGIMCVGEHPFAMFKRTLLWKLHSHYGDTLNSFPSTVDAR